MSTHNKAVSRADEHMQHNSKSGTNREGMHMQCEYEKELLDAVNMFQLKERVEVIVVTSIMVIHTNPHFINLLVKEHELRAPFEWLFGKEALGRYPWASAAFAGDLLDSLLKKVASFMLDEKLTLRQALAKTRDDSNFWFLHLYAPMNKESNSYRRIDRPPAGDDLPPLKRRRQQQEPEQQQHWNAPRSSSKGSAVKGRGKGNRRRQSGGPRFTTTATGMPLPSQQKPPPDWGQDARRSLPKKGYPSGQAICFDYHTTGCRGGCNRDHDHCPRMLKGGTYCFETDHKRQDCPHRH